MKRRKKTRQANWCGTSKYALKHPNQTKHNYCLTINKPIENVPVKKRIKPVDSKRYGFDYPAYLTEVFNSQ